MRQRRGDYQPTPNAALVRRLVDAWNAHDLDALAACYAPDYVGEDVGAPTSRRGPADVRAAFARYVEAFPDLHFEIERMVVKGPSAIIVWYATGAHRGVLMRIPPTGRKVAVWGASVLTIADGLIIRGHNIWDVAGVLRAIGLLPDL